MRDADILSCVARHNVRFPLCHAERFFAREGSYRSLLFGTKQKRKFIARVELFLDFKAAERLKQIECVVSQRRRGGNFAISLKKISKKVLSEYIKLLSKTKNSGIIIPQYMR